MERQKLRVRTLPFRLLGSSTCSDSVDRGFTARYDGRALGLDNPQPNPDVAVASASHDVAAREDHLERRLSPRQVSMIVLGGAIGTGFFLGSGVSVRLAVRRGRDGRGGKGNPLTERP